MRKLLTLILTFTVLLAFSQQRQGSKKIYPGPALNPTISVTGLGSGGLTPNSLVAALVGPGITYSNVSFTGIQGGTASASAGIFSAGLSIFGINDGVVLSSGTAVNSLGPNNFSSTTSENNLGGDADLAAVFGGPLFDACVLEFDFIPNGNHMYVQYVFGSEEYNEFVNDLFIDCFAFFLDGQNIAFVPGTTTPVSINSVNLLVNSAFYRNNQLGTGLNHIPGPYDIECDGFTTLFTADAAITPNVPHHIKLVIADKADYQYDSWVFLHGASFSTINPTAVPTLSEWGLIILGLTLLAFGTFYIVKMRG